MALPLPGFDPICLAVPSECLFGELYQISSTCGMVCVPQGSCLGPLLFTIYGSTMFDVMEKHLPTVHCYADDSQLYISFSPKAHSGQADVVASIKHCIQDIRQWMSQDRLLMNDAKTELLLIGTRQQLAKITLDGITVGHSVITPLSPESGCVVRF